MSTEQSQPVADSVEAGISALQDKLFGAVEPEAADEPDEPVETGAQAEDVSEQSEPDDEESQPVDSDYVEVEVDGEAFRVPPKLKDAFMANKSFTEGKQAIAERTRALEDRAQFIEVREALSQALSADMQELQRLEAEVKQFDDFDWSSITDLGQALQLQKLQKAREQAAAAKREEIKGKAGQAQAIIKQHEKRQQELARDAFVRAVGKFTPADNEAMLKKAQALGFTEAELESKVKTDERILRVLYEASKLDALRSGKGEALQRVKAAPPVVRPGAVPQYKTEQGERMNFRKAIKAARSDSQKADLIGNRLANKFRF